MHGNQLKRHRTIERSVLESSHGTSASNGRRESKLQVASLFLARITLLGVLAYSAWRFGGVHTVVFYHVAVALVAVLSMSVIAFVCFRWKPNLPSLATLVLPLAFIGYAVFQCAPLPGWLSPYFPHVNEIRQEFGETPSKQLSLRARDLGAAPVPDQATKSASIIPQNSKIALVPLMLAATIGALASLLFGTRRWRSIFLWFVLLNTAALSVWGIVQRSKGAVDVLPGIANTTKGLPFSSFYYRNAGAAAILPGIAAAAGLFSASRSRSLRGSTTKSPVGVYRNRHYKHPSSILSAKDLALLTIGCVVVVGVVTSLSRGAWVAAIAALMIVGFVFRREMQIGKSGVILAVFLAILTIATAEASQQIEAKLNRMSLEAFSFNERWDHWKNGSATAISYLPFGSGLGTYGYATLSDQTTPTAVWFQEAHNQYLQVLTESGIFGLAVLIGMIGWAMYAVACVVLRATSNEDKAFAVFGLIVLVCAVVHSTVDFVIAIPANLFLYASFFGILGGLAASITSRRMVQHSPASQAIGAIAIFASCAVLTCYCVKYSELEMIGDQAIEQTAVVDLKDALPKELIDERIAILNRAISSQPDRAVLYRHRALYQFARYRFAVIDAGKLAGESISWENTQPDVIFGVISSLAPASQKATIKSLLAEPSMQEPLGLALRDVSSGLNVNPLFSQLHLTGAVLSPLGDWDVGTWIGRAAAISMSDPDKLYACGLYAYYSGNTEQMTKSWADCLAVSRSHDKTIMAFGLKRMNAVEFAAKLMPPSKPEMLVALIQTVLQADLKSDSHTNQDDMTLVREVADHLLVDSRVAIDRRHAVAASIFELVNDKVAAKDQWLAAVVSAPKNSNYRYKAAETLRANGSLEEALRHVVLGITLTPEDKRFSQLASRIRVEISQRSE